MMHLNASGLFLYVQIVHSQRKSSTGGGADLFRPSEDLCFPIVLFCTNAESKTGVSENTFNIWFALYLIISNVTRQSILSATKRRQGLSTQLIKFF